MPHIKDEGCWIIQQVDEEQPWLGTRTTPFKQHAFYPTEYGNFSKLQCSTCGMVIERGGKVLSIVTPVLEPAREPTEAERDAYTKRINAS